MKILHLTWTLGVGGAEEMLIDIVNQQCCTEEVCIIVVNDVIDNQLLLRIDPRVKISLLNRKPGSRGMKPLLRLNWLVRRFGPDIVHAHTWSIVKMLPFCRSKTVLTVHTTADAAAFDDSIKHYDAVFAISDAVAEGVQEKINEIWPLNQIQLRVVVNGIRAAEMRLSVPPKHEVLRIVQVGRLEHDCKGQDILLRAVAQVRKQIGDGKVSLDFVGEGSSRHLLEEMVRDLELERSVQFCGAIQRPILYDRLCSYDLLVQPSRYEGFGLAAVEAMVAGVPVLVSDLEAPSGIIQGGRFGYLFRSGDDADCARAILEFLEIKRTETTALLQRVQAARNHALAKFDVKRTAAEYLREYRDILGAGNRVTGHAISEPI